MFVEHNFPRIVTEIQPDALGLATVSDGSELEGDVAPMSDHGPDALSVLLVNILGRC
jgi:hypothetical protein